MKKIIFIIFLSFFNYSFVFSQNILSGTVKDNNNRPLPYTSICIDNFCNCTTTDKKGKFFLNINHKNNVSIICSRVGFKNNNIKISPKDTITNIIIFLDPITHTNIHNTYKKGWGFTAIYGYDGININFNQFQNVLGEDNVEIMNRSSITMFCELAPSYNRYFSSFSYGFSLINDINEDSLNIDFNTSLYGLNFGYKIIDNKRLILMPKLSVKWYRYRLLNYDNNNKISIDNYMINKDLDIRFNQITGFIGVNLSYKIYKSYFLNQDFWTIGLYAGYITKLNETPWVFSRRNQLINITNKIEINSYNIGIFISFNTN